MANASEEFNQIRTEFESEIKEAQTLAAVEALQVKYLGKKGPIQGLMKNLKDVLPEERPNFGKMVNDLKAEFTQVLEEKSHSFTLREEDERLIKEKIDITLPGHSGFAGRKHILTHVLDEITDILISMGFSIQYAPEIDTDYYNFESLNFAQDHPARDMQDTFYITPKHLLRTHTSNAQVRLMEKHQPPIRVATPGKAYRNETVTARSHVFFHQVEGFYINKGVTFAELIATLSEFMQKLFKRDVETRFRPSYFPFVEPGMEIDVTCLVCEGKGCPICKHSGWLEIAGAGMIHPEVLKNGGIDPEIYTGFAWGMGIERLVMIKHNIKDIRMFTENDIRFLNQFSAI